MGTGTGVLARWCAKAGARAVYAVEASEIAGMAQKLVSRAKREQLEMFEGLLLESHGQNLAVTVLCVPHSLDDGCVVYCVCGGGDPDRGHAANADAPSAYERRGNNLEGFDGFHREALARNWS